MAFGRKTKATITEVAGIQSNEIAPTTSSTRPVLPVNTHGFTGGGAVLQGAPPTKQSFEKGSKEMLDDEDVASVIHFSEDIDDAEAPLPIPEGIYPAEIKDVRRVKRKTSGKNGVDVYFYIRPENYPADFPVDEAPDGVTLVYRRINLEDTKQGRFNLKRFIGNIGAPPLRREFSDETLDGWKGLATKVVIKHDEWEGNPRPVVDRVVAAA